MKQLILDSVPLILNLKYLCVRVCVLTLVECESVSDALEEFNTATQKSKTQ